MDKKDFSIAYVHIHIIVDQVLKSVIMVKAVVANKFHRILVHKIYNLKIQSAVFPIECDAMSHLIFLTDQFISAKIVIIRNNSMPLKVK